MGHLIMFGALYGALSVAGFTSCALTWQPALRAIERSDYWGLGFYACWVCIAGYIAMDASKSFMKTVFQIEQPKRLATTTGGKDAQQS